MNMLIADCLIDSCISFLVCSLILILVNMSNVLNNGRCYVLLGHDMFGYMFSLVNMVTYECLILC